jgi:1-deoxy-D-xylulose-5-phosphate reductoisomerase
MGSKITIDSATMMNKGFELIEASWLFDMKVSDIDIVIHPESIVHSLVEFIDGSVLAQLAIADMCIPIQYALTYPKRFYSQKEPLDLVEIGSLNFEAVDLDRFPCLRLAYKAAQVGGTMPTVLSSADEVAVKAFLDEKIIFTEIPIVIESVMNKHKTNSNPTISDILSTIDWSKNEAIELVN